MLAALLLIGSVAPGAQFGPDLVAAAEKARRDYLVKLTDQFATESIPLPRGTHFEAFGTVHDGTMLGTGTAYYVYRGGRLTFSISPSLVGYSPNYMRTLELQHRERISPPRQGTNGFGARTIYRTIHRDFNGVAITNWEAVSSRSFDVDLAPSEARQLALRTRIKLTGTVDRLPQGDAAKCKSDFHAATLDDPREQYLLSCYVAVSLTKIELLDGTKTLASWEF